MVDDQMTFYLQKGERINIPENTRNLLVDIGWENTENHLNDLMTLDIDGFIFLLGESDKLAGEKNIVFQMNPYGADGTVVYKRLSSSGNNVKLQVRINLDTIPKHIKKLDFVLSVRDGFKNRRSFSQIQKIYLRLTDAANNRELAMYSMQDDLQKYNIIMLGELYYYREAWKLNAVGNGFTNCLTVLEKKFGLNGVMEKIEQALGPSIIIKNVSKVFSPKITTGSSIPIPARIELKRIEESFTLRKGADDKLGEILLSLDWKRDKDTQRFFFESMLFDDDTSQILAMELACVYEMQCGRIGEIQIAGSLYGSFDAEPYILRCHDQDNIRDSHERMRINGDRVSEIKRILLYAHIYEGISKFGQANAVANIRQANGTEITIPLDQPYSGLPLCAIALIKNIGGTFHVKRLVRYFASFSEMAAAFKFV